MFTVCSALFSRLSPQILPEDAIATFRHAADAALHFATALSSPLAAASQQASPDDVLFSSPRCACLLHRRQSPPSHHHIIVTPSFRLQQALPLSIARSLHAPILPLLPVVCSCAAFRVKFFVGRHRAASACRRLPACSSPGSSAIHVD